MANYFYPNVTHTSAALALPAIARWLNDLDGVYTGPGWDVIASYSQYNSVGIDIPVAAPTVDSLNADNAWRTGTNLTVGDWIILESNTGPTPWQVAIEWSGTNYPLFVVAPLGGFNTTTTVATLLDAGNWANPKLTALSFDMNAYGTNGQYTVISDGSYFWLKTYNGVNQDSMRSAYVGLPEDYETADPCPAILSYNINYTAAADNNGYARHQDNLYRRLSPVDSTTEIELGCSNWPSNWVNWLLDNINYTKDKASGKWSLHPIRLKSLVTNHFCEAGKLRGTYFVSKNIGNMGHGTFANKTYAWHKNYSADWAAIGTVWDGVTALGN